MATQACVSRYFVEGATPMAFLLRGYKARVTLTLILTLTVILSLTLPLPLTLPLTRRGSPTAASSLWWSPRYALTLAT